MLAEGLKIADIDGRHEDDWCQPRVSGRIIATQPGTVFVVRCWTPEDPMAPSSFITMTLDRERTFRFLVPSGTVHECRADVVAEEGTEISFEIVCTNRPVQEAGDIRELSFVLPSMALS